MSAATLLMAIAAIGAEALHRRVRRGITVHPMAAWHVGRFAVAGAVLALIRVLGP